MRKTALLTGLAMLAACLFGCSPGGTGEKAWAFSFDADAEGFEPIFADYHDDGSSLASFEMQALHREIPVKGRESMGLYIAGHNRSDDLFMGYVKRLDGLRGNQAYTFSVSFKLATNVGGGDMAGIGGSPGSSVYVKGGVSTLKPEIALSNGIYRLNIDIGAQSEGGKDMQMLGNMEKPPPTAEAGAEGSGEAAGFEYKDFSFAAQAETDSSGGAYLIIGTDSGFEGFTEYYLDDITVTAVLS